MRVFLALLLLALFGYGGYLGFRWFATQYALLPAGEQPCLALVAGLTIVAMFLLTGAIRSGAREQAQQGLLVQRYRLYQSALCALRQEAVPPALQLKIDHGLALLGNRTVIQAFRKLRDEISAQGLGSPLAADLLKKLTLGDARGPEPESF